MASTGFIPDFTSDGHLPLGRFNVGMDEVYETFVAAERFSESPTRMGLWDNLTQYLLQFAGLEDQYQTDLSGRSLIKLLWLGGSFVSAKHDPDDIDLTAFLDLEAVAAVKGKRDAGWIPDAFNRQKIYPEYHIDPHRVDYMPVPHAFKVSEMTGAELAYFQNRGRYDDWWQRLRPLGAMDKQAPTMDSCVAARGYLEVTL